MERIQRLVIAAAVAALCAGCAEANSEDGSKSPVIDREQTIHKPGETDPLTPPVPQPPQQQIQEQEQPPVEDPPVEDPPVEDPPVEDPPVEDPPVDAPVKPPIVKPPAEEPDDTPDDAAIERSVDGDPVLPITYRPYTTLQLTHRPSIGTKYYTAERVKEFIAAHEFKVTELDKYEKYGMGVTEYDPEPWILRQTLLKATDPQISHKGKSIAYFWQISDPQIIDEESPCRMEGVNIYPYVVASAYRPDGMFSTHMFDLHVQTAKRISDLSSRPFDFALVTGDVADNAQKNEIQWFQRMMGGGKLNPDTGIDDDPIPGPGNDYNDPFYAQGIGDIPWYPAIGNHDMLYMGFSKVDDKIQSACTGDEVVNLFDYIKLVADHDYREGYQNGFLDGSTPEAKVVTSGKTPADPDRRLLTKLEALQAFHDAPGLPKGHGLDPQIMAKGWGYYSVYPIPNKPLRLITLDTNSGEFSEASMTAEQFEWLENEIADAKSKNELVIVQSHHGTSGISGAVTQDKFRSLLASYEGVILHITGHGHRNKSSVYKTGSKGYWEVMLASVVEFPSQTRIFEIVHEGNGIISIYITNLDYNAPKGTFGDLALGYASTRRFFSTDKDPVKTWDDEKEHRNLILRTRVPEEIYKNLEQYEWSDVIESEQTLNKFKYHPSK